MEIKYYLSGKEISPDDLAGKSGHLKMVVTYKNKEKTVKKIDGKSTMYMRLLRWQQECFFLQINLKM